MPIADDAQIALLVPGFAGGIRTQPLASVTTSPLRKTAPYGTPRPPVGWLCWQVSWLAGR